MTRTIRAIGAALLMGGAVWLAEAHAQAPDPTPLDPAAIPQFTQPLIIPPVMPARGLRWDPSIRMLVPYYEIEVVQFEQQILPPPLPATTVWSYGAAGRPETRNYPAFTIENLKGLPTRVKWINGLVDAQGNFLPHLLPIDPTLHWANPAGYPCVEAGKTKDCRPGAVPTDPVTGLVLPYTGPVPIVTHVHGAHVQPDSDGYPEAWYLPAAANIPASYATRGTVFGQIPGAELEDGAATFQYRNDQPSTTLWYHDHTLGMTRANVYAGPAGFYLVRELADLALGLPGPAPLPGLDPNGDPRVRRLIREIPLAIQDRSFNADGSLFYPANRDFFEGLPFGALAAEGIGFSPATEIAPIWNPEFFGTAMVVNGRTWPRLEVERRKYRFRLLNGSNSRFLILRFAGEVLPFQQIGGDQGFLPRTVTTTRLLLGPAERADVVVDFAALPAGTQLVLENIAPDEPFGGGIPCVDGLELDAEEPECDFAPANPLTTGRVMRFDVVRRVGPDLARVPSTPRAERPLSPSPGEVVRALSLNEEDDEAQDFGPSAAKLGTFDASGMPTPLAWHAPISERPALGKTEVWEFYNFTADAHPIHIHLVRFNVLDRQPLATDDEGMALAPPMLAGPAEPPEANELGYKDTVIAYPGQVTRVRALFDLPGLYVWHCHIVEHEDNEMMRPFFVGDGPPHEHAMP